MRVLFLLSCLEPSGSETYSVALAKAWQGKHEIFWISDQLHHGQAYTSMPIDRKAFPMGVVNTWRVVSFIRKHGIELVHSHSRRSHWVAAQAAKVTGIPHVTTIHQPLPVHVFSKHFPCLGDQTIAIDEAIVGHLRMHFPQPASKIHLIRNGIDLRGLVVSVRQTPNVKDVLLIGRLSGGRWKTFEFFVDALENMVHRLPPAHYKIVGMVPFARRAAFSARLSIAQSRIAPSTIESMGFVQDLDTLIRNSDGALAAGRSALECMALGRPVVMMGEGGVLGLCKPESWPIALRSNLGDHLDPPDFDSTKLEQGLREILGLRLGEQELGRSSRDFVEKYYDLMAIASQVEAVYEKAIG